MDPLSAAPASLSSHQYALTSSHRLLLLPAAASAAKPTSQDSSRSSSSRTRNKSRKNGPQTRIYKFVNTILRPLPLPWTHKKLAGDDVDNDAPFSSSHPAVSRGLHTSSGTPPGAGMSQSFFELLKILLPQLTGNDKNERRKTVRKKKTVQHAVKVMKRDEKSRNLLPPIRLSTRPPP